MKKSLASLIHRIVELLGLKKHIAADDKMKLVLRTAAKSGLIDPGDCLELLKVALENADSPTIRDFDSSLAELMMEHPNSLYKAVQDERSKAVLVESPVVFETIVEGDALIKRLVRDNSLIEKLVSSDDGWSRVSQMVSSIRGCAIVTPEGVVRSENDDRLVSQLSNWISDASLLKRLIEETALSEAIYGNSALRNRFLEDKSLLKELVSSDDGWSRVSKMVSSIRGCAIITPEGFLRSDNDGQLISQLSDWIGAAGLLEPLLGEPVFSEAIFENAALRIRLLEDESFLESIVNSAPVWSRLSQMASSSHECAIISGDGVTSGVSCDHLIAPLSKWICDTNLVDLLLEDSAFIFKVAKSSDFSKLIEFRLSLEGRLDHPNHPINEGTIRSLIDGLISTNAKWVEEKLVSKWINDDSLSAKIKNLIRNNATILLEADFVDNLVAFNTKQFDQAYEGRVLSGKSSEVLLSGLRWISETIHLGKSANLAILAEMLNATGLFVRSQPMDQLSGLGLEPYSNSSSTNDFDVLFTILTSQKGNITASINKALENKEACNELSQHFLDGIVRSSDASKYRQLGTSFLNQLVKAGDVIWIGKTGSSGLSKDQRILRSDQESDSELLFELLNEYRKWRKILLVNGLGNCTPQEFIELLNQHKMLSEALLSSDGIFELFLNKNLRKISHDNRIRRYKLADSLKSGTIIEPLEATLSTFRTFISDAITHLAMNAQMKKRIIQAEEGIMQNNLNFAEAVKKAIWNNDYVELSDGKIYFPDGEAVLTLVEEILINECYFFEETQKEAIIIDCGTHFGVSLYYYRKQFPNKKIICFEPSPRAYEVLERNIRENSWQSIDCHNSALSDKAGKTNFYEQTYQSMAGSLQKRNGDKHSKARKITKERLSPYLDDPVDFLKLDLEGEEMKVLLEIESKLTNVRSIFCEYHEAICPAPLEEIVALLRRNGYQVKVSLSDYYLRISKCRPLEHTANDSSYVIYAKRPN